ncbi:MAG: flavodoxin domain-containing protein [Hyphomonadaceae bacterium]|nr:flavodoxin domain-containing protein [Clostridia bacterium]
MKTIILFSTTYGCTKACADKLASQINGEVSVVNVMTDPIASIAAFDNIVLGGSIYMGQLQKKLKTFCTENINVLLKKRIALFLCCGLSENFEQSMHNAFPEQLLNRAVAKECFGGELHTSKMNLVHKMLTGMMTKVAAKEKKPPASLQPENIAKLAKIINGE